MEQWQLEVAERLARIEANQEYMKASITNLPQSEKCEKDILALQEEVDDLVLFKTAIKEKIAYIGGVIVVIGLFVPYAIEWLTSHFHWKTP